MKIDGRSVRVLNPCKAPLGREQYALFREAWPAHEGFSFPFKAGERLAKRFK